MSLRHDRKERPPLFPLPARSDHLDLFPWNLQIGPMVSASVQVAVQLRLADHLEVPKTLDVLAQETETYSPVLYSLLRALSRIGIFEEIERKTHLFANTERSRLLRTEAMADLVSLWGTPYQWNSWRDLLFTVQTGKPALQKQLGPQATFWNYLQRHPQEREAYHRGWAANTRLLAPFLLDGYDFSEVHHVVDVGGGYGALTHTLLRAYPHLKATLFDQPSVIEQAYKWLPKEIADRCTLVPGDFFRAEHLPQGADCYLFKNVMMDWSDEAYMRLLSACYQAMDRVHGRLLIIEQIISEDASFSPFFSLQMSMLMQGAHHRSLKEHGARFEVVGFWLMHVRLLGQEYALLEGRPQGA